MEARLNFKKKSDFVEFTIAHAWAAARARGLCVTEPYNTHNEMEALQNMIMTGMAAQGHAFSPEQVRCSRLVYSTEYGNPYQLIT